MAKDEKIENGKSDEELEEEIKIAMEAAKKKAVKKEEEEEDEDDDDMEENKKSANKKAKAEKHEE